MFFDFQQGFGQRFGGAEQDASFHLDLFGGLVISVFLDALDYLVEITFELIHNEKESVECDIAFDCDGVGP